MSDFKSLSTANLPDPAIDPADGENPEDHFNTVTYSGTSGDKAVTGVGFQPDWVWIKQTNSAADHQLYDSVRGVTKLLESNQNLDEQTKSEGLKSFDSDGFTHGVESAGNDNTGTHVAWNWKMGGTAVSNSNGSLTSSVSANTTAGMSVVTYTGNKTNGATVGHGLSQTPEMLMTKARNHTVGWAVWHTGLSGMTYWMSLNDTAGEAVDDMYTAVSATTFTLGEDNWTNGSGYNFVTYCFHSVEGFSKFGSYVEHYVSDYDADSPYVHTGFRPAFLMIKGTSNGRNWVIYDNKRTPDDGVYLVANTNAAEATDATNHDVSFLSNGFKIRGGSGDINTTNESYIYMAFADQPFKFANGGTE